MRHHPAPHLLSPAIPEASAHIDAPAAAATTRPTACAFSLVELSIVLVILGLLVGGILAGQSLIRASELRSVAADFNRFKTAYAAFQDRYLALPGDMSSATRFWPVQDPTPATCKTTASSSTATCDGNGDGRIIDSTGSYEPFRAWQHLANAGLVEGTFNGVAGSGGSGHAIPGINSPAPRLNDAAYDIRLWPGEDGTGADQFAFPLSTMLRVGRTNNSGTPRYPVMRGQEAWNIDVKLDDGTPGNGIVRAYKQTSSVTPNCATSDAASTAAYNLASSSIICAIQLRVL